MAEDLWPGLAGLLCGATIWAMAPGPRGGFAEVAAVIVLGGLAAVALPPLPFPAYWVALAWLWLLLALGLSDLRCRRLPDVLTGALALVALARAWGVGPEAAISAFGAGALAMGAFWGLRLAYAWRRGREGLGLGDVKLMFGIGAGTGLLLLPWVTLVAALSALALALGRRDGRVASTQAIPFGAYLAGAAALVTILDLRGWPIPT